MSKYVILDGEAVGGKAKQLIKLSEEGFNVPWFKVIPAEAQREIDHKEDFILGQLDQQVTYFSVRSSAVGEDGSDFSFAGQFDTFLYVKREDVFDKIKQVYASTHSERIEFYRKQNGIEGEIQMAVIIQKMVNQ